MSDNQHGKVESPASDAAGLPRLMRQDTQPAFPVYHRRFGNPAPLGTLSFAAPTFLLSLYTLNADGVMVPNVIVGMAILVGGVGQFMAGMWEFVVGNTLGATVFGLFSTFWMSYGLIYVPGTGILDAYTGSPETAAQLHNALGLYLITWFILGCILAPATLRSSLALVFLVTVIDTTILLLAIAQFTQSPAVSRAGGAFGLVTAIASFYVGAANLYTKDVTYFTLPTGVLSREIV